jgi:O-methyltransferase involved in polyketide biosynthesis
MADPKYDPISYTARKILEARARYTRIPHVQEMADALQVPWRAAPLRDGVRSLVWGELRSGRYLQLRYDAISGALQAYPRAAVLEIAAGYSTRGIDESGSRQLYVESDLGALIANKQQIVRTLRGEPSAHHRFLSFDVCSEEATRTVLAELKRCALTEPLVVIHEGLLMYFDPAEQRAARDHIATLLREASPAGGAWITTDFSERELDETFLQRLMSRKLNRRVERRMNYFPDDAAAQKFLAEGGLRCTRHAVPLAAGSGAQLRRVAENFAAYTITLDGAGTRD